MSTAPYSSVNLPIYRKVDRFTREYEFYMGGLYSQLETKFGQQEAQLRSEYEEKEQTIYQEQGILDTLLNTIQDTFFLNKKYVPIFIIIILLLYFVVRVKK